MSETADFFALPRPRPETSNALTHLLPRLPSLVPLLALCSSVVLHAQSLPFRDDFDDGDYAGWSVTDDPEPQSGPSRWVVERGVLAQTSNIWSYGPVDLETKYHLGTHITTGDKTWTDYTLNAWVRSTDNDGVGLIVRYQDAGNYYRVLLMNDPAWSGRDIDGVAFNAPIQRIQKFVGGEPVILAENKVDEAYPSGWFALSADVRGDTLRAYLNGELILTAVDETYADGKIGLLSYANSGAYYDQIAVTAEHQVYQEPDREVVYPVTEDRSPYIQRPTQTSIGIAWRTVEPSIGRVRFGATKGALDREVVESESRQKHYVTLDGLEPGRMYHYEVYAGEAPIRAEEEFRTAPTDDEDTFAFLVLGDSGVNTVTQYMVSQEMRSSMNESEVAFVVHVGDVHQGVGDYYDDVYFKPYRDIIKNVNVFTAIGNHDTYTDDAAVYLDDFYLPHNNPDDSERYYSFRWGNAYFICLDTNIDYSPGSPQYEWFVEQLNDAERLDATWTFVYAHHPPWTEYWTNYFGEANVQDYLVPLFESYGVDMVMNGHTHSYERGEKNHVHYLVSGGGGGGLDDYFMDYEHISFSEGVHHFTRIDVDGDQLWVTATDMYGRQVDRFLVNKRATVDIKGAAMMEVPERLELVAAYPNPVRDRIHLEYRLPTSGRVTLDLFDARGRRVDRVVERSQLPDTYTVTYAVDGLPSGVYTLRLTAGDRSVSRSMTVVR